MIEVSEDGDCIEQLNDRSTVTISGGWLEFKYKGEGPNFSKDDLVKMLPFFQRFIDTGTFGEEPDYEILEFDGNFVVRRIEDMGYWGVSGWGYGDTRLYARKEEAEAVIAELERGES